MKHTTDERKDIGDIAKPLAGSVVGAVGAGAIGKSIGIAAMGTAIAGTWPLAVIGGVIGGAGVWGFRRWRKRKVAAEDHDEESEGDDPAAD